ncbi:(2Fe-2S)-binding protein [Nitrospirillum viridazoti]|uniref:(2Fe-2S)-binding protein n=1 Tax=Nitrospirillum viridazoti TaxID=3144925 RepID=UPI0011ADECAB|nr:(2Fe-2S)-binding protein [Nitrospirillum amazonense]TWB28707.1 xanthine dehydrogenase YagT iron-sulfur-binding subunit [Nitrospirillum amazonense]
MPDRSQSAAVNRRHFLAAVGGAAAGGATTLPGTGDAAAAPAAEAAKSSDPRVPHTVTLTINGQDHQLSLDARASLLDTLRDRLGLTGTKKGCDHGQCGACTVLVDGRRELSCLRLAVMAQGRQVTTIEGLAPDPHTLHPMQQAFIDHDAFQCGYCTPGQILSAVACVKEGHAGDDDQIREYMSGNICRCAAYPNIVAAIRQAKTEMGA